LSLIFSFTSDTFLSFSAFAASLAAASPGLLSTSGSAGGVSVAADVASLDPPV